MSTESKREFTIVNGPDSDHLNKALRCRYNKKTALPIRFRVTGKDTVGPNEATIMMDATDIIIADFNHREDDVLLLRGCCKVPLGDINETKEESDSGTVHAKKLVDACFAAFYNPETKYGRIIFVT